MTKILVVDDSEFFRQIYSQALVDAGFEVELAENGQEAIEKMIADPPSVVFLDLVMPVMTGEQVLSEIRKHKKLKSIPVIMLTSISAALKGAELLAAGPLAGYLTKDTATPKDVVARAIEVLSTSEQLFDPKKNK
jgi:CheY-like chemotaxis protein